MLAAVALTFGTERNDGNAIGARARGGEMDSELRMPAS
jgi:hypothetical protein